MLRNGGCAVATQRRGMASTVDLVCENRRASFYCRMEWGARVSVVSISAETAERGINLDTRTCGRMPIPRHHPAKRPPLPGGPLILDIVKRMKRSVLGRPGSDLLFQALRLSTIGAEDFDGRVRDGIGYRLLAMTTRPAKDGTDEASDLSLMDIDVMRAFKPIERLVPVS